MNKPYFDQRLTDAELAAAYRVEKSALVMAAKASTEELDEACSACNGSGEGQFDGARCGCCGGSGDAPSTCNFDYYD